MCPCVFHDVTNGPQTKYQNCSFQQNINFTKMDFGVDPDFECFFRWLPLVDKSSTVKRLKICIKSKQNMYCFTQGFLHLVICFWTIFHFFQQQQNYNFFTKWSGPRLVQYSCSEPPWPPPRTGLKLHNQQIPQNWQTPENQEEQMDKAVDMFRVKGESQSSSFGLYVIHTYFSRGARFVKKGSSSSRECFG